MNTYIDIYCERIEPGLLAEPLNAITNLAFIIAGFFALHLTRKENALNWRSGLMIVLVFAMGIGSTLFHTYATLWAMMTDVLPILAFQIAFIVFYAQNIIKLKFPLCFAPLAVFLALMYGAMQLPRELLNGSLEYAPALIMVTTYGLYHLKHATREKWGLLAVAGAFTLSMTLRSIDIALCHTIPLGTHFLWHCLNAIVLYLSVRAYILNVRKS